MLNVFTDLEARLSTSEKVVEELKRENTGKLQNTQLPVYYIHIQVFREARAREYRFIHIVLNTFMHCSHIHYF